MMFGLSVNGGHRFIDLGDADAERAVTLLPRESAPPYQPSLRDGKEDKGDDCGRPHPPSDESLGYFHASLRDGTRQGRKAVRPPTHPAMNRWAIFMRPSGTKIAANAFHGDESLGYCQTTRGKFSRT